MTVTPLILLVNDIPDHRVLYEAALRARGFLVTAVQTAGEALARARGAVPDCAVIDVRLRDLDGWELCERFKSDVGLRAIPIVMLAQDLAAQKEERRRLCSAWLARPTVADDVVRSVEHVMKQGLSEPPSREEALLGVRHCPACQSEEIRAGVGVGPVQYYSCRGCGLYWRLNASGEATA